MSEAMPRATPVPAAGNVYDKYGTKNPVERFLVSSFISRIISALKGLDTAMVLEVGCGEGYVSDRVANSLEKGRVLAFDLDHEVVKKAKGAFSSARFFRASVYDIPLPDKSADIVLACEVLEHLDDPEPALVEMARVSKGHILVSVPREPLWRAMNLARLKYVAQMGNTPGHVQHWSRRGIIRLLSEYFDVVSVSSPIPWTVCLCRIKD